MFINSDLKNDIFFDNYFDFIFCNGVLHHTKDPYNNFVRLISLLKKDQIFVIGLYNRYGRIRTIFQCTCDHTKYR